MAGSWHTWLHCSWLWTLCIWSTRARLSFKEERRFSDKDKDREERQRKVMGAHILKGSSEHDVTVSKAPGRKVRLPTRFCSNARHRAQPRRGAAAATRRMQVARGDAGMERDGS